MPKKQADLAVLVSATIYLKSKIIKGDREGQNILIKGKIHQEGISIFSNLNIYATNAKATKLIKETLLHCK